MKIAYANLLPMHVDDLERFHRPPLAAGFIAAYLWRHRALRDQHDIVSHEDLVGLDSADAVADRLLANDPDIVALSVYVWNRVQVRKVAARVRALSKRARIVLGGPDVAYTAATVRDVPADWICTGEGEVPFLRLVEALDSDRTFEGSLSGMYSVRNPDTAVAGRGELVANLDDIPSPYELGLLTLRAGGWVDLETTRGCPYRCRFCLYGKGLTSLRHYSDDRVTSDVLHARAAGVANGYVMDPTFNFPPERCMRLTGRIAEVNVDPRVTLATEIRAELVDEPLARALRSANFRHVEVGLQSSNRDALRQMRRGLGVARFVAGCRLLAEHGIFVSIGVILGLPGDDPDAVRRTVDFVTDERLGYLCVYRLQVLPGSEYFNLAADLGVEYDSEPPYYVRATRLMTREQIGQLELELTAAATAYNAEFLAGRPGLAAPSDAGVAKKSAKAPDSRLLGATVGDVPAKVAKKPSDKALAKAAG